MKISQLTLTNNTRVETHTDAHACLMTEFQRDSYIAQYGDVEVTYDKVWSVWRVASFAAQIAAYTKMKAVDCTRFGCE